MKLYHAVKNGKVTSSVQEDYDRFDTWVNQNPNWILQEEVSRDNSILKVVDNIVMIDDDFINARDKEAQRQLYKAERDLALMTSTVELDGMIFQTSPNDFINFTVGIDEDATEWILADNSVADVTTQQLELVLDVAKSNAKLIFDDYIQKLKTL